MLVSKGNRNFWAGTCDIVPFGHLRTVSTEPRSSRVARTASIGGSKIEPRARPYAEIMKKAPTVLGLITLFAASACGSSYAEPSRGPAWSGNSYSDAERTTYRPSAPWSDQGPVVDSPYRVELLYGDWSRLKELHTVGGIDEIGRAHV